MVANIPVPVHHISSRKIPAHIAPMVSRPGPAPKLPGITHPSRAGLPPIVCPVITPYRLAEAILAILRDAPAKNLFASLTNPVWDGWATWRLLAWRLPPSLADAYYSEPDDPKFPQCYWHVEGLMAEMAQEGLLEKRLHRPHAHSSDQVARGLQEWQFRIPGHCGYCFWEPAAPLTPVSLNEPDMIDSPWHGADVTQDNWQTKVSPRDGRMLLEIFPDARLPLYILAQIERRWIARMMRPAGQGRNGRLNLR